ncbi:hypothetical protein DI53_3762 [Sphingobacterium deserti]|uniref:Calpastatin n=2 Tax=Sphingobacterium deserti TaxID=1229276 RepID=A0A0B8SYP9_9SPHI|nr:hypothetical protein DI53_3762 [Sphingobacterium deserti]
MSHKTKILCTFVSNVLFVTNRAKTRLRLRNLLQNDFSMSIDLDRFLRAQNLVYLQALQEVQNGKKRSHWMWYIFPQITGLGSSDTAKQYAIRDGIEAKAFLKHPVLGSNLRMLTKTFLNLQKGSAEEVFGTLDSLKLRSSMTLFEAVSDNKTLLQRLLISITEENAILEQ